MPTRASEHMRACAHGGQRRPPSLEMELALDPLEMELLTVVSAGIQPGSSVKAESALSPALKWD